MFMTREARITGLATPWMEWQIGPSPFQGGPVSCSGSISTHYRSTHPGGNLPSICIVHGISSRLREHQWTKDGLKTLLKELIFVRLSAENYSLICSYVTGVLQNAHSSLSLSNLFRFLRMLEQTQTNKNDSGGDIEYHMLIIDQEPMVGPNRNNWHPHGKHIPRTSKVPESVSTPQTHICKGYEKEHFKEIIPEQNQQRNDNQKWFPSLPQGLFTELIFDGLDLTCE